MVASLNAFMHISGADGESEQPDAAGWIELQSWEWEVEAETSWTKGGGASVGKPSPSKMSWEHYWDTSSAKLLGYICTGSAFDTIKLRMFKNTGKAAPISPAGGVVVSGPNRQVFWEAVMKSCFITKVNQSATEDGNVTQKIEMVFKEIQIEYKKQKSIDGSLEKTGLYKWDIPGGTAEPSV